MWLEAKIIGILNFIDDGENDYKIVCLPADDRNSGDTVECIDDLGRHWKRKIEHHFSHYKDFKKPGSTNVLGWGSVDDAKKIVAECIERFRTNSHR